MSSNVAVDGAPMKASRILAGVLGLFLLFPVFTKANDLINGTPDQNNYLASTTIQIMLVLFELTLSVWLLSGRYLSISFSVAILVFTVFGLASLRQALLGNASCGCFGAIKINPWLTTLLDFGIVFAMVGWFPSNARSSLFRIGA